MSSVRDMVAETVGRLLADHVTKELLGAAEQGTWPAALWDALVANGITQPMTADGGGAEAAFAVVHAAGRFAAPVPLAETILAGWLLSGEGLAVPDGVLTVAPMYAQDAVRIADGRVTGVATRVPFGRQATHVVVVAGDPPQVALVSARELACTPDQNLAREPRDTLTFDRAPVLAVAPASVPHDAVLLYGALVRSVQMAGALEALVEHTVRYANERVQFGQPIGKFQAVQQQLAVLAEHAAAAAIAAEVAFEATERGAGRFEIAVAKARIGEAAEVATGIAHAVHGAIGFTYEHHLHFLTRRLWAWRAECGTDAHWQRALGREVLARGADRLWASVVDPSAR